eukprot:5252141-Alexandrium_andersonii.AAC.1
MSPSAATASSRQFMCLRFLLSECLALSSPVLSHSVFLVAVAASVRVHRCLLVACQSIEAV